MTPMEPIQALQEIVAERGLEWVLQQPEQLEYLLGDHCQRRRPEIHFLVSSLKEQIPQRLMSAYTQTQMEAAVGQARVQLQTNLGIRPENASWTVDAWLGILGKKVPVVPGAALALMKQLFEKGATVEQVASLLTERGMAAKQEAAAMAKEHWAGLSAERQQAIRQAGRKTGAPAGWQQKAWIAFGVLVLILCVYEVLFVFLPGAWYYLVGTMALAERGDYVSAIMFGALAVLALVGFVLYVKGKL